MAFGSQRLAEPENEGPQRAGRSGRKKPVGPQGSRPAVCTRARMSPPASAPTTAVAGDTSQAEKGQSAGSGNGVRLDDEVVQAHTHIGHVL